MIQRRIVNKLSRYLLVKNMPFCLLHRARVSRYVKFLAAGAATTSGNIRRILQTCEDIIRRKLKRKSASTARHKKDRVGFAKRYARYKKKWRTTIFTDEKRFNLKPFLAEKRIRQKYSVKWVGGL